MRRGAKVKDLGTWGVGEGLKAESGEGLRGKARARRSFLRSRMRAGIYEGEKTGGGTGWICLYRGLDKGWWVPDHCWWCWGGAGGVKKFTKPSGPKG